MNITDPRVASRPFFSDRVARFLNDPRDASLVALMLRCAAVAAVGVSLYFVRLPFPVYYLAPLYWVLLASVMDRFTLMLHCTSHRQLFKNRHGFLNQIVPSLLGPFFGQTPNTYFAHHMGMHHREENLGDDLSSTLRFRRDRLGHWLRYWGRFMAFGVFELSGYFRRRKNQKLFRRVVVGELVYWSTMLALLWLDPVVTLIVFLGPLLAIRTVMMMGNWAQHAFVCASNPRDPYLSSITCINTRYNRRCFNDGYHILHHVKPRCHWTEHPVEFERALAEYGARDAIVFDGIDYFQVWLYLMTGRWSKLAARFVALPDAPARTEREVIEFLQRRVMPITASAA